LRQRNNCNDEKSAVEAIETADSVAFENLKQCSGASSNNEEIGG
jgi:hypothetical protein